MPPTLQITLLGEFQLVYSGEPITGRIMVRAQVLLAYLALHADKHPSRRSIASALWPDSGEGQARTNLRQLLHHLRRSLPDAERFLDSDEGALAWRSDAPASLDVVDFTRALARAAAAERTRDTGEALAALEEAVGHYRGDLLPGCDDEWIVPERERLREEYLTALARLVGLHEDRREYRAAIRHAERLLVADPLREAIHRELIRCHALHGDRAAALRAYRRCADLLLAELGVQPDPATTELYARLIASRATDRVARPNPPVAVPLVGRWREWATLRAAWHGVAMGQARFIVLAGEAGIGKTRLAEELLTWGEGQGIATARAHYYAAEGRLAYAPVAEWLRAEALRAGWPALAPTWRAELGRVLPEARDSRPEAPANDPPDEAARRQRFFEALARATRATGRPLLLLLDDLQWCDHETLAWLRYLLRYQHGPPLLIVATLRSEDSAEDHPATPLLRDLGRAGQLIEIALGPLDATETAALAGQIADHPLTEAQAAWLYRETEGYPLFAVERARAGLLLATNGTESAVDATGGLPAVRAVLATRLAQLSPTARALAGLAATVGRAFTSPILAAATDADAASLARDLDELWQRRIVRAQGIDAYDFSHDKLREAAYAALGPAQRRLLHRQVAQALERLHAADLAPISGQLAAHYEQAGLTMQAVETYNRAAEAAQQLFASDEAIGHFRRTLALLATLPETHERAERELALQVRLAASLTAQSIFAAPEVVVAYMRARDLCLYLGKPLNAPVLHGLASTTQMQGEILQAREYSQQLLDMAEVQADPVLLVEAHYLVGANAYWRGDFRKACSHLERALDLYDPNNRPTHIGLYARDPGLIGASRLALILWLLGYPERAMQLCLESLEQARILAHPFSHLFALTTLIHIHFEQREFSLVQQYAIEVQQVLAKSGYSYYWSTFAKIVQGWVAVEQGKVEGGLAMIQQGLADFYATGIVNGYVQFNRYFVMTYARTGKIRAALAVVQDVLQCIERTEQRDQEAEMRRLQAELLLADKDSLDKVEQHLLLALAVARRQGAKIIELRTLVDLCRIEQLKGSAGAHHRSLQRLYDSFTEGFETTDLRAARRVLVALG